MFRAFCKRHCLSGKHDGHNLRASGAQTAGISVDPSSRLFPDGRTCPFGATVALLEAMDRPDTGEAAGRYRNPLRALCSLSHLLLTLTLLLLSAVWLAGGTYNPFIHFRF